MASSPRDIAKETVRLRLRQEALLKDLLPVVDALDRAEAHWSQAMASQPAASAHKARKGSWWQRIWWRLVGWPAVPAADSASSVAGLVASAREGIAMIRATMLDVLAEHEVVPVKAMGHPFDPQFMHALGQQRVGPTTAQNTVTQEVVRGYLWRQQLLREAQVMVAAPPEAPPAGSAP